MRSIAETRLILKSLTTQSQTTGRTTQTPEALPPRHSTLKRKKPAYAESSSEDDVPLAMSSQATQVVTAAVAMPGAMQATTVPASLVDADKKSKVESDEDDDEPLQKKKPPKKRVKKESAVKEEESDADFDAEDTPPAKKKRAAPARKRKVKAEDSDVEMSEDEKPLGKKPPPKRATKKAKVEDEGDEDIKSLPPKSKKRGKAKAEEPDSPKKKTKAQQKKEEEEAEIFRWWDQNANGDGSQKWTTLEHNGVLFPPPYEPLPKNIKMKYDGLCSFSNTCEVFI